MISTNCCCPCCRPAPPPSLRAPPRENAKPAGVSAGEPGFTTEALAERPLCRHGCGWMITVFCKGIHADKCTNQPNVQPSRWQPRRLPNTQGEQSNRPRYDQFKTYRLMRKARLERIKVCVPGWHRLTSRTKTSSSLKRFCPAATLFDPAMIGQAKGSREGPFFCANGAPPPISSIQLAPTHLRAAASERRPAQTARSRKCRLPTR